jgi:hypothetical protein
MKLSEVKYKINKETLFKMTLIIIDEFRESKAISL